MLFQLYRLYHFLLIGLSDQYLVMIFLQAQLLGLSLENTDGEVPAGVLEK